VTREVIDLKDQLDSAAARIAEGDIVSDKAAKLATENVDLKANLDEMSSKKLVAEEKLQLLETVLAHRYVGVVLTIPIFLTTSQRS
jgi:hypothetical protein